ncbi:aldehyde dehydrogenase 3F1 [Striga asiatica]|uniref:Aldehyde dehydrogenase 3F1 n=1 Tax=Striga asiatica TaxID=4170 RepID=A0A5A7R7E9_STRAF|nr:aldehyde dehydrogenase 3F1 [Striga asiatica]
MALSRAAVPSLQSCPSPSVRVLESAWSMFVLAPNPGRLLTPNALPTVVPHHPNRPHIKGAYVQLNGGELGSKEKGGDGTVVPGVEVVGGGWWLLPLPPVGGDGVVWWRPPPPLPLPLGGLPQLAGGVPWDGVGVRWPPPEPCGGGTIGRFGTANKIK